MGNDDFYDSYKFFTSHRKIGNISFFNFNNSYYNYYKNYKSYRFFTLYQKVGNKIFFLSYDFSYLSYDPSYDFLTLYRHIGRNGVLRLFYDPYYFFTLYQIRGNAVFYVDNYYFLTSNTFSDKNSD